MAFINLISKNKIATASFFGFLGSNLSPFNLGVFFKK